MQITAEWRVHSTVSGGGGVGCRRHGAMCACVTRRAVCTCERRAVGAYLEIGAHRTVGREGEAFARVDDRGRDAVGEEAFTAARIGGTPRLLLVLETVCASRARDKARGERARAAYRECARARGCGWLWVLVCAGSVLGSNVCVGMQETRAQGMHAGYAPRALAPLTVLMMEPGAYQCHAG